jgi:anti-sigma regulatory factor (Ser/Thr protein kinase)
MNVHLTLHRNGSFGHNGWAMMYASALVSLPQEASALTGCALSPRPDEARKARSFTRDTLATWGLADLADDAVVIVGELLANAVQHAGTCPPAPDMTAPDMTAQDASLGLWLLRHPQGFMCVVTDQSDQPPTLRQPGDTAEGGRGLHVIHSLSDHWGWTPLGGQGKAVWALLFRD